MVICLKEIVTGYFFEALSALIGKSAPGLSSTTISRLKSVWTEAYEQWLKRDLSGKHYVYIWADGVYCNIRMDDRQCILATMDGEN